MSVRVGVLALQGDFREHAAAIRRIGHEAVLVRHALELEGIDALVIPGGESTTIGKLADRYGLVEPLQKRIADGLAVLGTCAGMIFLASGTTEEAPQVQLGVLDVIVERNAFGRQVDSFEAEIELDGLDSPIHGVFIRAPDVAESGAGVEVLATVRGRPVAVRQGRIMAISFHPELTDDGRLHSMLVDMAQEH